MLEMLKTAIAAVKDLAQMQRPTVIAVDYPSTSQFAGAEAGQLVRVEDGPGQAKYSWVPAPLSPPGVPEMRAELVYRHCFAELFSFARFAAAMSDELALDPVHVFVGAKPFEPAGLQAFCARRPEAGTVTGSIARHPSFLRWLAGVGSGNAKDLTHEQLADLLVDNQEDLDERELAAVIKQFRAAKTVEYDADLDAAGSIGLRTTWKGNSKAEVHLPREFGATFPAYSGAWAAGDEPKHSARFRLRLVPPKGDAVVPTFRVIWVNALDFELEAARVLAAAVQEAVHELPVYLGAPSIQHFVLPTAAT